MKREIKLILYFSSLTLMFVFVSYISFFTRLLSSQINFLIFCFLLSYLGFVFRFYYLLKSKNSKYKEFNFAGKIIVLAISIPLLMFTGFGFVVSSAWYFSSPFRADYPFPFSLLTRWIVFGFSIFIAILNRHLSKSDRKKNQ